MTKHYAEAVVLVLPEMKNFKFIIIFLCFIYPLQAITIREKIKLSNEISSVTSFLYKNEFDNAKNILLKIKSLYPTSEYNIIADYFLAQIGYSTREFYSAIYYIDLAKNEINDRRLSLSYKEKIQMLTALLYYETGLTSEAENYFQVLLGCENPNFVETSRLYLGLLAHEKKDKANARYYLFDINPKFLNSKEKEIYQYLMNFISWSKIETKDIGYGDPNICTLYAQNDILYIGLWNGGLIRYNYILDDYQFFRQPTLPSDEVRAIYDAENFLWIGTNNGITKLSKRDDTFTVIPGFENMRITNIYSDNINVYIGTLGNGCIIYNLESEKYYQILNNNNISTMKRFQDKLLIATYNAKLYSFNINSETLKEESILKKNSHVIKDIQTNTDENMICFATYGGGIYLYNTKNKKVKNYSQKNYPEIQNDYFMTIAENKNVFYCGSLGNGIYSLDNEELYNFPISDFYIGNDIQKILYHCGYLFIATLGEGVLIKKMTNN